MQVIIVPDEDCSLPDGLEAKNGLTKAMQDARKRRFRKVRYIDPKIMRKTEDAIIQIIGVSFCSGRFSLTILKAT